MLRAQRLHGNARGYSRVQQIDRTGMKGDGQGLLDPETKQGQRSQQVQAKFVIYRLTSGPAGYYY